MWDKLTAVKDRLLNSSNGPLSKRNIVALLLIGIGVLSVPLGVDLVQTQTNLKSQAANNSYTDALRKWAEGIVLHPCVGLEFASLHNGRFPASVEELNTWGDQNGRRSTQWVGPMGTAYDPDGKRFGPQREEAGHWTCLQLSEGTGVGWRDRGHEDLYRHSAAVEQTFEQIMCRRPTREEWAHWGYGRNIAISTLRAELAASEEGMTRVRAGGCGATGNPGGSSTSPTPQVGIQANPAVSTQNAPQPPTALRAASVCTTSGDITLRWKRVEGATGYIVKVNEVNVPVNIPTDPLIRPYAVFRSQKGQKYSWTVQSSNGTGTSAPVTGSQFSCNT